MTFGVPIDTLRGVAEQFLPESAQVQRPTDTATGDGTSQSWSTIATVAARLSPAGNTAQEQVIAQQIQAGSAWRITLPHGTDVTARDRIVIAGRTFHVAGVLGPKSYQAALIVIAEERT